MAQNEIKKIAIGSAVAATIAVTLAGAALAQGGPPPGVGGPGGFGGPGGPRPMAFGTVQSVDAGARTITLNGPQGSRTIHVTSDAKIVGEKTISASDLKVGDKVQVRGHATTISADSIVAGNLPPMGPPPMAGGQAGGFGGPPPGPGGFGGPAGRGGFGGGGFGPEPNSAGPPQGPGFGPGGPGGGGPGGVVMETGTVKSVNPLTISFGGDRTVTVNLSGSTKVSTVGDEKLGDIKKGDQIAAQMRPQDDGTRAAVQVAVNLPMPGPMGGPGMGRFGLGRPGLSRFQPGGVPNGGFGGQAGGGPGFGGGGFGGGPGFGPPPQGGPGFGPQDAPGQPQDAPSGDMAPGPGGDFGPPPAGPPPADAPDGAQPNE